MAKTDLMHKQEMLFAEQMITFKNNIGTHAVELGVTPAQMAAQAADADFYYYVVVTHMLVLSHAKGWTAMKKSLRRGCANGEAHAVIPLELPVAPPAVAPGVEKRFRQLVRQIKASTNYTPLIGLEMGIEAKNHAAPDYVVIQPRLTAVVNGDHVELGWDWQGHRAFLDLCELQVDRSDGHGFGPLTSSTKPGSQDITPFPAAPTRWRYRAIYHADGQPVGQWSNIASVTVPP
jgi:hypothetical protein